MHDDIVWRLPAYGSRSFDLLPATVERLFTGRVGGLDIATAPLDDRYDHVVLIYFDAFGWRFVEQHGDHPLLRDAVAVERLTSQFPSTTTAHTPTIHSGLPVAEHGLYEWHVLEPSLNRLVTPLLFCFAGDAAMDGLTAEGVAPDSMFPRASFYERLAQSGIAAHVAQPAAFAGSASSRCMLRGSTVHPFVTTTEALAAVGASLSAEERAYGFVYLPEVDSLMHHVGPDGEGVAALFESTLSAIGEAVRGNVFPAGTLVLVTADHGMAAVSPERTSYVNVVWPGIAEFLALGADGKPLAPAGSCRDLFLHVRPGEVEQVVGTLAASLDGIAEVHPVEQLVEQGLFGPAPSAALRARLADVVCLPYAGEAVYWLEAGRFEQRFNGQHGGLTPEEMDIPLVASVTDS
jgi:Type I phosphodiesterase / nucleotide pyrophosphatase